MTTNKFEKWLHKFHIGFPQVSKMWKCSGFSFHSVPLKDNSVETDPSELVRISLYNAFRNALLRSNWCHNWNREQDKVLVWREEKAEYRLYNTIISAVLNNYKLRWTKDENPFSKVVCFPSNKVELHFHWSRVIGHSGGNNNKGPQIHPWWGINWERKSPLDKQSEIL